MKTALNLSEISTADVLNELKTGDESCWKKSSQPSPLKIQVGGGHYKKWAIQPVEYIHANNIPFVEGCVIKYMSRWRDKGGVQDLEKAKHFIDMLIELEKVDKRG